MKCHSKLTVTALFMFIFNLYGCSNDPISVVKNGTLTQFDKSVRVGDAFDNYSYFVNKEWKTFNDGQNRSIVEFSATINEDKLFYDHNDKQQADAWYNLYTHALKQAGSYKGIKLKIQFVLNTDGKSFEPRYIEVLTGSNDISEHSVQVIMDILQNNYISCVRSYFSNSYSEYVQDKRNKQAKHDLANAKDEIINEYKSQILGIYVGDCKAQGNTYAAITKINSETMTVMVLQYDTYLDQASGKMKFDKSRSKNTGDIEVPIKFNSNRPEEVKKKLDFTSSLELKDERFYFVFSTDSAKKLKVTFVADSISCNHTEMSRFSDLPN